MTQVAVHRVRAQITAAGRPFSIPVGWAWAALFVNVLAFIGTTVVPGLGVAGQLLAQGSLPLAIVLALLANRHGLIRPNLLLVGLTTLAIFAFMVSVHNQFVLGSTFRSVRFLGYVTVLWLLTPWWGRSDMMLLRVHRTCMAFVIGTVILGFAIRPGAARPDGRLTGIVWPIPPTQVGHYSAVMLGSTILLWMCHVMRGRSALVWILVSTATLLGSHTRTALLALMAGLTCALASLFLSQSRVRRTVLWGGVTIVLVALMFANEIRVWALRGQSTQEAGQLTGRTTVWTEVLHANRGWLHDWFGSGLSNMSWNGLAIDSTWVATYLDLGIVGVVLVALTVLLLLFQALSDRPGPGRGIAIFLVVYCLFASVTETGLGAPSPYFLDLVVAASLLGASARGEWR